MHWVAGDDQGSRKAWRNWLRMQRRSARLVLLVWWYRREASRVLFRDMEIVEPLVYTFLGSSAKSRSVRCWEGNGSLVVISEVIAMAR